MFAKPRLMCKAAWTCFREGGELGGSAMAASGPRGFVARPPVVDPQQRQRIDASRFFPTPPSPTPPAGVHLALFHFYNQPAPISTELEFPCGGSGTAVFNPVKGGETATAATVSVSFVGQA
jgi:hypothetical protein